MTVQKEKGFTLMELMIAVAILGIFAAIAVPSLDGYLNGRKAVAAAEAVYNQINYARSEAISRSKKVVVRITEGDSNTWAAGIELDEADPDCTPADTLADDQPCVLPVDGVNVLKHILGTDHPDTSLSTNTTAITFDPVRGTATGNGSITVTLGARAYVVAISVIGRVRICSPTNSGGYATC